MIMKKLFKYLVFVFFIIFLILIRYEKGYVYYGSEITLYTPELEDLDKIDLKDDSWRGIWNQNNLIYVDKNKEIILPGKTTLFGYNQSYIPIKSIYIDLNFYPFSIYANAAMHKGIEKMGLIVILYRFD